MKEIHKFKSTANKRKLLNLKLKSKSKVKKEPKKKSNLIPTNKLKKSYKKIEHNQQNSFNEGFLYEEPENENFKNHVFESKHELNDTNSTKMKNQTVTLESSDQLDFSTLEEVENYVKKLDDRNVNYAIDKLIKIIQSILHLCLTDSEGNVETPKDKNIKSTNDLRRKQSNIKALKKTIYFTFNDYIEDLSYILASVMNKLSRLIQNNLELKKKPFSSMWRDICFYYKNQRSNDKICMQLCYSLDDYLFSTFPIENKKFLRFLACFYQSCIISCKTEKSSLAIYSYFSLFKKDNYDALSDICQTSLRKLLIQLNIYSKQRLTVTGVQRLSKFINQIILICSKLKQQGYSKMIYFVAYKEISEQVVNFNSNNKIYTTSEDSNITKKTKIIKETKIDWSVLLSCSLFVKLMFLEKNEFSAEDSKYSLIHLVEPYTVFLLACLNSTIEKSKLIPTSLNLMKLLLILCKASNKFIPFSTYIIKFSHMLFNLISSSKTQKYNTKLQKLLKPLDITHVLKLNNEYVYYYNTHDKIIYIFKDLLIDYLCVISQSPFFVELADVMTQEFKKIFKLSNSSGQNFENFVKSLKEIIEQIVINVDEIKKIRQNIDISNVLQNKFFVFPTEKIQKLPLFKFSRNNIPVVSPI